MTVKELIKKLETLEQNLDISVFVHNHGRPICHKKPIENIEVAFDQDTHKASYSIDIDVSPTFRIPEERIITE